MDRPIVMCGLGRMGARVLEFLRATGLPVVVVDTVAKPDDPRLQGAGVRLVQGDCRRREVLEQAGVASAGGVLILTNDDLLNVSTALMVRALAPDVRIVLRMFNQNLLGRLGKAVTNVFALSTSLLTAPALAMTAVTGQGLGTFRLEGQANDSRLVVEVPVSPGSELRGQTVGRVAAGRGAVVVAHLPAGGADRVLLDVDLEAPLEAGDRLVLCGPPRSLTPLLAGGGPADPSSLLWANWLSRMGRVGWQALTELDLAVLLSTGVLTAVLLISTVVLHVGVTKYNIPTALFRTVSIMATSSQMHDEDFEGSERLQVFVSCLRIIGAVLLAAFTAIITNYLLRARLGGVLEARRIPEAGHVVVCGLSTIGFRVVEELLRFGARVVVIEKDADSPFVTTTRRLGVPVLIGDATLREVQQQAQAQHASALIAATTHDLSNLSVALLARRANPHQRVVALMSEPTMAGLLCQAAAVELALSVPALVAPAFMASLF